MQFGSGRSSGSRWLPRIALACLVLAAIVAVAVRDIGHHAPHAATVPRTAVRVIAIGHPFLGVTAGWELSAVGPDDQLRIQLAKGKILVRYMPPLRPANVTFVVGAHEAVIRSSALVQPYDSTWPQTDVIAPDDSTAAVAESGRDGRLTVHLINLRSGVSRDLDVVLGQPGINLPLGADLNGQSMVWSPDSRWLFVVAAGGKLVAVNARTGRAELLWTKLPAVSQIAIRA